MSVLLLLITLLSLHFMLIESAPVNSSCHNSVQQISFQGIGSCPQPDGDVFLMGQYIQLGLHYIGSFGSESMAKNVTNCAYPDPAAPPYRGNYHQNNIWWSKVVGTLSFISDSDRNGFYSLPKPSYAGDYTTPGIAIEGTNECTHFCYIFINTYCAPLYALVCTYLWAHQDGAFSGWTLAVSAIL